MRDPLTGIDAAALDAYIMGDPDSCCDDSGPICPLCGEGLDGDLFCSECAEYFDDEGRTLCPECGNPLNGEGECDHCCSPE